MEKKIRIGIMISGTGTNMQAIVRACEAGQVDGNVVFVGADNSDARGLKWADGRGVPTFVVDYLKIHRSVMQNKSLNVPDDTLVGMIHKKSIFVHDWFEGSTKKQYNYLRWKIAAENRTLQRIREDKIDLLVLAGFMQVCTSYLIDSINEGDNDPRIMNIHPALLPSFPGVDGYGDTINYGCKVGGCTVHFVDYGEDTGPIIGQQAISVLPEDDVDSFRARGLQEEYKLFPECIQSFIEGRLSLESVKQRDGSVRKVVKISDERS